MSFSAPLHIQPRDASVIAAFSPPPLSRLQQLLAFVDDSYDYLGLNRGHSSRSSGATHS